MAIKLGLEAKIYYSTTFDDATSSWGTWVELGNATDVTLNLSKGEADVTVRNNNGWRATVGTLKEGSVDFEMIWDTSDAGFTAFFNAWQATNGRIACAVMDGDITTAGSQGLRSLFSVIDMSRSESLEEAIRSSVSIKPTYGTNLVTDWLTVAAS